MHIEHEHRQAIKALTLNRNKLQHDGLTHNALAIEARAAHVRRFLTDFMHLHLTWRFDGEEREDSEVERDLIRGSLSGIKRFASTRMNGIKEELATCPQYTVQ
ncbi:hypothetical protein [Streptomyces sp. ALI-76-A]|uniref:hypothetical protein n=1 Tax=Streptomyces sp. ALI-76-A TaxID=3025736 RepID=UPI00256F509A|nr:hypothetical protein [Streptomyces sp. ALI-76-A]MDL5198875.1 hypothetical protein [Streptomyces sp. ALI-76-A]